MFVEATADEITTDDDVSAHSNSMSNNRPLHIAKCRDISEVMAAVNFARDNGLRISVRGDGHDGPGVSNVKDCLVIDLSSVKGGAACRKALNWSDLV